MPGRRLLEGRRAGLGIRVEHGEFQLFDACIQVDEQVVDFVQDLGRSRVVSIDLVDHDDWWQATRQGLAQHESGLREWTL